MKIYLFSLESISLPVLYALNLKKTAEFKFNIHQNAIDNRVLFISI